MAELNIAEVVFCDVAPPADAADALAIALCHAQTSSSLARLGHAADRLRGGRARE